MSNTAFRASAADVMGLSDAPAAYRDRAGPVHGLVPQGLLQLEIVTERAAFDTLEPEWDALFERAAKSHQAFQRFGWLWHWCNHYLPGSGNRGAGLAVVAGRAEGRLVMVWPLVIERVLGLRQLAWMGDTVSQYGDVVVEPAYATIGHLRRAYEFAVKATGADLVLLRKVRADAVVAPALAALGTTIVATDEAPFIDLAATPSREAFDERMPNKSRRNRRRQMRRLEERGRVAMEELQPGDDCRAVTQIAVSLKRAWLKRRGGYSRAIGDPRFAAFFGDAAGGEGPATGVSASVLRCAGEATAINIALACKGRQLLHIIVYNSKFERAAAGILHVEAAIHRAIGRGDAAFDFLAPRHDYKMVWASGTTVVNDHAVGCTAAGRAWAQGYWKTLRPWAKRLVERITSRRTGATERDQTARTEE